MFNMQQAGAGKPVYRMGSYAPNRGQVNPSGYLKRELSRHAFGNGIHGGVSRNGADGESDTRSGLAHDMLRKRFGAAAGGNGGMVKGMIKGNPVAGGGSGGRPIAGQAQAGQQAGPRPGTSPSGVPVAKINANGQLDLPYDYDFTQAAIDRTGQVNSELQQIQRDRQAAALQYVNDTYEANRGYDTQKLDSLNGAAGSGRAFSSGYGLQVANDATNYNNLIGRLNTGEAQSKADTAFDQNALMSDFNRFLQNQAVGYGDQLNAKAGTLGLGKVPLPPVGRKRNATHNNAKAAQRWLRNHSKGAR